MPEDLWQRAQARRQAVAGRCFRAANGQLGGRPPKDGVKHLLAGLASCAVCGGGLAVETSPRRSGRAKQYVCHRHGHRCTNDRCVNMDALNEAVLAAIEAHALTPEAIAQVIAFAEREDAAETRRALETRLAVLNREIAHSTSLVTNPDYGEVRALIEKLKEQEREQFAVQSQLADLRPIPRIAPEVVESHLARWRTMLRSNVMQARAVIQRIIRGRIVFTPTDDGGGAFTAETRFDRLFEGWATPRPSWIAPGDVRGTEHITAEIDAEYARLLEQAARRRKLVASPAGWEDLWKAEIRGIVRRRTA